MSKDYFVNARTEAEEKYSNATGEKSLDFQGVVVNVLAVTAFGAVVGALVSKKNILNSVKIGAGAGLLLGIFGGFQVLRKDLDNSKA
jgi:hypothetical protein